MLKGPTDWTEQFRVRSYEMDSLGVARVSAITNYLQETAANHAEALGWTITSAAAERRRNWVLVRLHVHLEVWPRWREAIEIETWPSGFDGLVAFREFLIKGSDGQVIGSASSAWMMVDLARRRATRLPEELHEFPFLDRPRPIEAPFPKIHFGGAADASRTFAVRRGELDINGHVNQQAYVEWACETMPEDLWRQARPVDLAIAFRSETRLGETVESRRAEQGDGVHVHQLRSLDDGRELATLRSVWRRVTA
jgi:medium-chain acyl-[acyl-carrier-protein] hydrolase